ncbi:MAG: hypothetical protein LBU15_02005 [Rickettsiales bacterium]|nr:hypothetical protein [Rickettsiales bacterium]
MDDLCSLAKKHLNGKQLRELYFLMEQMAKLFEDASTDENCITLVPYEEGRKFSEFMEALRLVQETLRKTMTERLINLDPRNYDRELNSIKAEIISRHAARHSNGRMATFQTPNLDLLNELQQVEALFRELRGGDRGNPPLP